MVAWFCALFYLPRLFVYHAEAEDELSQQRFVVMERRLYKGLCGCGVNNDTIWISMLHYNFAYYLRASWMHAKLALVLILWSYHLMCGHYRILFARNAIENQLYFSESLMKYHTLLLIAIVILVVVRP